MDGEKFFTEASPNKILTETKEPKQKKRRTTLEKLQNDDNMRKR